MQRLLTGILATATVGTARADDIDAYCASRFRSYDPESGTYLG